MNWGCVFVSRYGSQPCQPLIIIYHNIYKRYIGRLLICSFCFPAGFKDLQRLSIIPQDTSEVCLRHLLSLSFCICLSQKVYEQIVLWGYVCCFPVKLVYSCCILIFFLALSRLIISCIMYLISMFQLIFNANNNCMTNYVCMMYSMQAVG